MAFHTPVITGDSLATQSPASVRHLWHKGVQIFEQTADFFREFEGPTENHPIMSKTETSKGAGQKIVFTTMAGLHAEPHLGEEIFEDETHFEDIHISDYELEVDWFRHGVRYTERAEEKMGMRGELASGLPKQIGLYLGRLKTEHMMMMYLHKGVAGVNRFPINGRATADDLLPTDTFDYDNVLEAGAMMQTTNGKPAYVGKDASGNPIYKYIHVATSDTLFNLDQDPEYKADKKDAGARGVENLLFKGGYHNLRGQVIKEYTPIDHDGAGPIGSAISPKASLGEAITAGTATFTIKGGGVAARNAKARAAYFRYFPNYAYKFLYGDTLSVSGAAFYVIVYNTSGADRGKWGFYECTTNTGLGLTVTKRLHSADGAGGADIRLQTVGNVTWDAAQNTNAHPEGSHVFLASKNGTPRGSVIVMGACNAYRGYGKYRNHRGTEEHEDGFVRDIFMKSVFGQAPRLDTLGRAPGFRVLDVAIQYPGISIVPDLP